jgi:iron-sulfur cluster repair protein YtfE (RIC family)
MKSKEEIEQLAEKAIPLSNENIDYVEFAKHDRKQWINGYTQCQEDMADKKYTEEDILFAFLHGGTKFEENKDITVLAKNFKELKNSLNKQD